MENKLVKIVAGIVVLGISFSAGRQIGIKEEKAKTAKVLGQQTSKILKIGAILPLTGDLAYVGREIQRGMELALKNSGDKNAKIVYEDDLTFDIKSTVNAASKLVNVDRVDVVLNSAVDTIKSISPILNQNHVPGIVIWDSNKIINSQGPYVYGMGLSTEHAGEDMAQMAYNKLNVRRVSVISNFNEWSEIISRSFIEKFQSLGGSIDYHEKTEIANSDSRVHLAKIMGKQSEAIYFPGYNPSLQSFFRQSKDLGFKGYLLTGDTLSDADIQVLGEKAEGIYSTQPFLEDTDFLKLYKQEYGQDASAINLSFAGMGYDAVNFLLAIKKDLESKNAPVTSESINQKIIGFEFIGVTGKTVFSPQRITDKREIILQVKNGQLVKP